MPHFWADFHFHMITENSKLHDCRVLLLDRGLNQCDYRNEIWIRTTFKFNKKCTDSFINELPPSSLRGPGCWLLAAAARCQCLVTPSFLAREDVVGRQWSVTAAFHHHLTGSFSPMTINCNIRGLLIQASSSTYNIPRW